MIDIAPHDLETVKRLISTYFPDVEARVFGSRYKWTAKDYSDLDIVLVGAQKLDWQTLNRLREALAESNVPFRVDVLDWHTISPEFQQVIEQGYAVIQKPIVSAEAEWQEYPFADVINFQEGPGILAKDFQDEGTPLIRLAGLGQGASLLDGCNYLDPELVEKRYTHFKVKSGDVLLSTSASLGRTAVVDKTAEGSIVYTGLIRMRPADNRLFAPFIFYLLESPHFQQQIEAMGAGSVIKHFGPSHLRQMTVMIPSVRTQRRVTEILAALDEKIELNRQTNATLEAIAQAIFKEWFVNFNYPGATGKLVESELGLIPAGWRIGKLDELCKFVKGVSYKSDELQPSNQALVTLRSINRGGGFNFDGFKEYVGKYKESQVLLEGDLIIAQTDITQNAEVVGCPAIVENPLNYEKLIASLDLIICRPMLQFITNEALYYFFKQQNFKDYCLSHTNGSTVLHLRSSEIPNFSLLIPDNQLLAQFNSVVTIIRSLSVNNHRQIQILSHIRDILLPKLMRGEIEV